MERKNKTLVALLVLLALVVSGIIALKGGVSKTTKESNLKWLKYDEGLKQAYEKKRYILIDFYTDWCYWCKKMDKETYADSEVKRVLEENFVLIKVNAESSDKVLVEGKEVREIDLARKYQVTGYPTTWFLEPEGKPIAPLAGYAHPQDFFQVLNYIKESAYKKVNFSEYLKQRVR